MQFVCSMRILDYLNLMTYVKGLHFWTTNFSIMYRRSRSLSFQELLVKRKLLSLLHTINCKTKLLLKIWSCKLCILMILSEISSSLTTEIPILLNYLIYLIYLSNLINFVKITYYLRIQKKLAWAKPYMYTNVYTDTVRYSTVFVKC